MRDRWVRRRGRGWLLACSVAVLVLREVARADDVYPDAPILRIEAGMHTAQINRIAVDARGRYVVTASYDKTARVWDLRSGNLLNILRPPIGQGNVGMLYAVAISPDGSTIAVGGWTGVTDGHDYVYLFDRASGRLTRRLGDFPDAVEHLVMSLDGRYLAVTLGRKGGVRVLRLADGAEVMRDVAYADSAYRAAFNRNGELATTSDDGWIRLYGPPPNFTLLRSSLPIENAPGKPYGLSFNPQGDRLSVGFADVPRVMILSANRLEVLYEPEMNGIDAPVASTTWSLDGERLLAGGQFGLKGSRQIVSWSGSGRGLRSMAPISTNTIKDISRTPAGKLVVASADPLWAVFDKNLRRLSGRGPPIHDLRSNSRLLKLSRDAGVVDFVSDDQNDGTRRYFRFEARLRSLKRRLSDASGTFPAVIEELKVTGWESTETVKTTSGPITLAQYETAHSIAGTSEGGFILGSEWYLRRFDAQGKPSRTPDGEDWVTSVPETAWAVNVSRDQRLVVAALGDGTIRWYGLKDAKERLALFLHVDGRWVVWTPEGFYDCSPGGEKLIGYHLNQGPDREGKFVGADQMRDRFFRPDIVASRLFDDKPAQEALRQGSGSVAALLQRGLPPEVEILDTKILDDGSVQVRVRARDKGAGVGKVTFSVDGHAIEGRGPAVEVPGEFVRTLPLAPGRRVLSVSASTRSGDLESVPATKTVESAAVSLDRPTLYVLTVGVDRYLDGSLRLLENAQADTRDLATALRKGGRELFRDVQVVPLFGTEVTLDRLRTEFDRLKARVKATDVFVLYLAGHGTALGGEFYFYPQDLLVKGASDYATKAISGTLLMRDLVAKIPATKRLVMIDSCGAGAIRYAMRGDVKSALIRLNKASGEHILAATENDALEKINGHGAFTAALLEALGSKAVDTNKSGDIDVVELATYVQDRVPEMTKAIGLVQQPIMLLGGVPFPVATVPSSP